MTFTKFGIRIVGEEKPLGFYTSRGGEEFCVSVEYELDKHSDNVWMVDTYEQAKNAMETDTEWFNADYETPKNPYTHLQLEVVEIEFAVKSCN